jgi:CDP-diacylglycerol---glycerol-3-phosphate 3-phosphatidyltransferase
VTQQNLSGHQAAAPGTAGIAVVPGPGLVNLPNALTVLRLVLVPFFVAFLVADGTGWRIAAFFAFGVASFTDILDGELARRRRLITDFGKIADPIADKALTGSALVTLSALGDLSWWVTGVIMAREVGVTVLRFWVIRRGVIPASRGGKVKTVLQVIAIGLYILPLQANPARTAVLALAVAVTLITGADYVARVVRLRRAVPGTRPPAAAVAPATADEAGTAGPAGAGTAGAGTAGVGAAVAGAAVAGAAGAGAAGAGAAGAGAAVAGAAGAGAAGAGAAGAGAAVAEDLASQAIGLLVASERTIGTAESLTGGLVAAALTTVPGASAVFVGGIVAYSAELKAAMLGVSRELLERHGTVHADVALAMAAGAREHLGASIGVATTGVAGPDPVDGQPPGTAHIAVDGPDGAICQPLHLSGDRAQVRRQTVDAALALLIRTLREEIR